MTRLTGVLLAVALGVVALGGVGCAPPPPRVEQEFVPEAELQGVALAREGISLFRRSRFADAEVKLRQALYLFPDARNLQESLAVTLLNNGQQGEAEAILHRLLERPGDRLPILSALAESAALEGRYEEAVTRYRRLYDESVVAGRTDTAVAAARSLAAILFLTGDEGEAECWSGLTWQLRRDIAETVRHARLLIARHRYAAARDIIGGVLGGMGSAPDPALLHQLAFALYGLGEFREAERAAGVLVTPGAAGDPGMRPEALLVYLLAHEQVSGKLTVPPSMTAESGEAALQELIETQSSPARQLYWPWALVRAVAERRTPSA